MIAAYRAMEEVERGALIVSDPKTGEILALVSKPSFDANLFTLGADYDSSKQSASESAQTIETLFEDANQPLFNRVIGGTYPPGSTFKIITAAAGLETGEIDGETEFEDIGVIRIGAFSFPNWYFLQYGKTEGFVDIVKGLKRSNDIFFYKAAELVGLERLGQMARHFGLGEPLGINMEGEASGLFPSDEWKRQAIGEQWFLGDTYHLGIGQGYLLTTPLQVNFWTDVIANNGTLCEPTIVKSEKCKVKSEKFLSEETLRLIKEGMREACADGGTGWPLFKFKIQNARLKVDEKNFFTPEDANPDDGWVHIPVACKTGTAEFGDPKDRTHAWFTAYAPMNDPELVVTVLVEAGGEGSNVAAPIAKKVFEEWFGR
jgi:penicillin-binding protein 2